MNIFMSRIMLAKKQNRAVASMGRVDQVLVCGIGVSEFELWSRSYVYFLINTFGKVLNLFIFHVMGWISQLIFINKDGVYSN